jgi:hypothetical protein
MLTCRNLVLACWLQFIFCSSLTAQQTNGLVAAIIAEKSEAGTDFPIVTIERTSASIRYDASDHRGVLRAISDLQADINSVTGVKPRLVTTEASADYEIVIGTLGESKLIGKLVSTGKLDVGAIKGKWESFVIATLKDPKPGVKQYLVIAGSDKRGTIYGIYELSRQLGVSPWYWWADVPAKQRAAAYVRSGYYASDEPAVRYRGIFINDEAPCFTRWSDEKFGGRNSKMYAHVFELLLRLRANYFWPAMWSSAFNEDDPDNPRIADEYGIVMGTSHHEPMLRSQVEWSRHKQEFGNGEWNYSTNKHGIQEFWRQGLARNRKYESILTMGMRGDGDLPMPDAGDAKENFKTLEGIMADQRKIIEEVTRKPVSQTPQIWALYSEVLEYYDQGMRVPDDMIILLCDDNWGDVRRLPELGSKKHPGGYGIYYHVDLHGAPRAYQWLNMTPIPHMWEQLHLTYSYGVDKVWILNVGDLKPMEYPMTFFLDMAWKPGSFNENNLHDYARMFCEEQFGADVSAEAADILDMYCKYNGRVTAEMLNQKTYNLESGEFLSVKDAYLALEARALRLFLRMPETRRDSYRELILHPVQAMANLYDMFYAAAMNEKYAAEKDLRANFWADRVMMCFERDTELSNNYNKDFAGGKWNHMMDQTHIGYTSWDEPKSGNIMPKITRVTPEETKQGGIVFTEKNGVVAMEAEHYFVSKRGDKTNWSVIPDLGRTLSGVALRPYTERTDGASITYKMIFRTRPDSVKVHMFFSCTLPFKKGGHRVAASFDARNEVSWSINDQLTWKNNYARMYPAGAARMIETVTILALTAGADSTHTLTIRPLDPGIVMYKLVIDDGGFERTYLKMRESPYKKH